MSVSFHQISVSLYLNLLSGFSLCATVQRVTFKLLPQMMKVTEADTKYL